VASTELDTAIVGLGNVSTWHRRGLRRCPGATLTAICDLDAAKMRRAADEWGVSGYTDTGTLLERAEPDWVHVCTPVGSHADIAERAMRAGAHALVEKPVTETRAAYESLMTAAEETGRNCTVVHNQVYYPPVQTALRWIREGRFGRLHGVSVRWLEDNDPREPDRGKWVLDLPGGEFGEGIVHPIYVGLRAAGYPADETAVAVERINTTGDEAVAYDGVSLSYRSDDDVACTIQHHSGTPGSRQIEFFAAEGRVVVDIPTQSVRYHPHGYGGKSTLSHPNATAAYWTARNAVRSVRSVAELYVRRASAAVRGESYTVHDTHTPVIRREIDAIVGDGPSPTPRREVDWTNRLFTTLNGDDGD
jgi:predicted dehydrogenase